MTRLRLVPLEDLVVFPGMTVTLPIEVEGDEQVFLVPRRDTAFAQVGVVAQVNDQIRVPGRGRAIVLSGLHRGTAAGPATEDPDGTLRVEVEAHMDDTAPTPEIEDLERQYRAVVAEILDLREVDDRIRQFVRAITEPGALADTSGYAPDLTIPQKIDLLETLDVTRRLAMALQFQRERLSELQLRKRIREEVDQGAQKQQRDYLLRRQMEAIQKELGEDNANVTQEYRAKIEAAHMPDAARAQAERELSRLERLGDGNAESSVIRTYLDWMLSVPWDQRSEERLDPVEARRILDADHAGLDDVKSRITEYLAVRKLRVDRGVADDRGSNVILALIGPPGTGKTSIGESIARATGRKFVRMSLGGVRDEAEIRGHRRTYIGALPGRLIRALRDAGTMNPVIMLDEADKLGADWRGDPSSALLEVLDPAQNHTFRDHYLDVEVDLSDVLFLATANVADAIPPALRDRLEILQFDGYTTGEKLAIARGYLWPRQLQRNALRTDEIALDEDTLREIITNYTREAGVRQLERELGTLLRKSATKIASGTATAPIAIDEATVRDALGRPKFHHEEAAHDSIPGVATGLAVTGTGGDVLFVEAAAMPGDETLVLTGQLGDVMKESARIALSWVKAHTTLLEVTPDAVRHQTFHVHVPAGAIPKDGPSAGITMVTALASLLSGRPVKPLVGMTGEVTLQGRVLPIGGVKQKVLAAHAAGLRTIILPERNLADLDDVPGEVREALTVHGVSTVDQVLAVALEARPSRMAA